MEALNYEEIALTNHAQEKDIPDFEVQNILEKQQGQLFKDLKEDSYVIKKQNTIVAYIIQDNTAVVVTAYRQDSAKNFSTKRYQEIPT